MCVCLFVGVCVCVPYWWPVTFHLRRTAQEWSCGKSDGLCYQTCVSFTTEVNKYTHTQTHTRAVVLEFFCQCWNVTCRTLPFLVMRMTCQTSERHATMKKEKKKIVDVYLQTPMSRSTENQILDFHIMFSADDKEDSILGSILLPSFHISMLSVDDHISRKYAFKVEKYIYQQLFSVIWTCWFLCNVGKKDYNNYIIMLISADNIGWPILSNIPYIDFMWFSFLNLLESWR